MVSFKSQNHKLSANMVRKVYPIRTLEKILNLNTADCENSTIMKEIGLSRVAIVNRIKSAGLTPNVPESKQLSDDTANAIYEMCLGNPGCTSKNITYMLNKHRHIPICNMTVYNYATKAGYEFNNPSGISMSEEKEKKMIKYYKDHPKMSITAAAKKFGTSYNTFSKNLRKHDIKPHLKPSWPYIK